MTWQAGLGIGYFPAFTELLRGFCIFDMPSFPCPVISTADYGYFRFHGSTALYGSCYTEEELGEWAQRIRQVAKMVSTVYIYFNNDAEAYAVGNALRLGDILDEE